MRRRMAHISGIKNTAPPDSWTRHQHIVMQPDTKPFTDGMKAAGEAMKPFGNQVKAAADALSDYLDAAELAEITRQATREARFKANLARRRPKYRGSIVNPSEGVS